jgi:hypothetical protein
VVHGFLDKVVFGVFVASGVAWGGVSFGVVLEGGIEGAAEVIFIEDTVVFGGGGLAAKVAFAIFRLEG